MKSKKRNISHFNEIKPIQVEIPNSSNQQRDYSSIDKNQNQLRFKSKLNSSITQGYSSQRYNFNGGADRAMLKTSHKLNAMSELTSPKNTGKSQKSNLVFLQEDANFNQVPSLS